MINEQSLTDASIPKNMREAILDFFEFAGVEEISHWSANEWAVERWSRGVDTLFFRPLFSDHCRYDHAEEIALIDDFIKQRTDNCRFQVGFFAPYGKYVPTREELRASLQSDSEEQGEEIDYSNLTQAVNIETLLGGEEGE